MILRSAIRTAVVGLLAAGLSMPTLASADTADAERAGASCHAVQRKVAIAPGRSATVKISGTLCVPTRWSPGKSAVDVLVHGGSYNSSYWDWAQYARKYSYVRRATADGRATFAFDRPGTGASDRPLSTGVTVSSDAYVLHQLISWLRSRDYQTVNLVSHSIGGLVAIEEAARYDDIDRLVVTGMLHGTGVGLGGAGTFVDFYPALLDSKFAGTTLDPGWMTTLPGTRAFMFYSAKNADPAVIRYDEAHKDVTTELTLLTSALANKLPPPLNSTNRVRVPVLVTVGQEDALFCGLLLNCASDRAVYRNEAPYYSSAESLTVKTFPRTGHNMMLHPSVDASYALISDWLERTS
ncbi:alpha/beta hydrolase [Actinopolymorpha alba]|uniref:alpha/beta hydrolase n=1 Tax=Actinopolymorpha alba TaxID=533267 RepID=UPI00035D8FD7|nr:alpha/beta hydrolase [Actinopolymorpha alba]